MSQAAPALFKIPTKSPQPAPGNLGQAKAGRSATGSVFANGVGRTATRGDSDVLVLDHGVTVYPAREAGGRWRAVWYEDGQRRKCEASGEDKSSPSWLALVTIASGDSPVSNNTDVVVPARRTALG